MKWIVLAIVLVIVPYTIVTLLFRKPQPAFEPYHDIKKRANVSRLLAAGYQRIPIVAQRPADGARTLGGAAMVGAAGGLPADLRSTLVEAPLLPVEITGVIAAPSAATMLPYAIQLTCTLPDDRQQHGGADLYLRGEAIVIAPTFERVAAGLETRSRQSAVVLIVPAGTLKTGRYSVTLVGERASLAWPLDVQ